jgi:hypothetical protein
MGLLDNNGQRPSYSAGRTGIAASICGPRHRPSGRFPLILNLNFVPKIRSEKVVGYSYRNACVGAIFVARRAGT